MIRALILSHDFPPVTKVGALRAYSWYLDFHKFGIYPTVITRNWEDPTEDKHVRTETGEMLAVKLSDLSKRDRLIEEHGLDGRVRTRKALTALANITKWTSPFGDDKRYLYKAAEKWLQSNEADIIIATGEPFILFKYAYKLGKQFNLPYILDYRDGWTTNHIRDREGLANKFFLWIERQAEAKFLSRAAFFNSVHQQLVSNIVWDFDNKIGRQKGQVLENGAELSFQQDPPPEKDKHFTLLYTGSLYAIQRVDIFIEGFKLWREKNPKARVKIRFVGVESRVNKAVWAIRDFAAGEECCEVEPAVPFHKAIELQQAAHMLISFVAGSQAKGIMGGKTYEYAATRNPILVIPAEGGDETTFFPGRDIQLWALTPQEVAATIDSCYEKFERGESTQTSITEDEIFSISREYQTSRFARNIQQYLRRKDLSLPTGRKAAAV